MLLRPNLVMFSDASVFLNHRAAGWGFWIKGDGRASLTKGGPLKEFSPDSTICELEAMANGLATAKSAGYFREDDSVIMLQTDSAQALGVLLHLRPSIPNQSHETSADVNRQRKKLGPRQRKAATFILSTLDELRLQPVIRHVRGHKTGDGRNWVNRLCDRLAKDGAMQKENRA